MPHLTKLFWFILLPSLFFAACQEDDDCTEYVYPWCPNYDPCAGVSPADAEILLIDSTTWTDSLFSIEVDTTLTYSQFYFRPKNIQEYATYSWRVGSDPRTFEGAIQDISFLGFEGEIEIQLTVNIDDPNNCLSVNERTASSSKSIYMKDMSGVYSQVYGNYEGYLEESPDDTVAIELYGWDADFFKSRRLFNLPLPEDCNPIQEVGIPIAGGHAWFLSEFVNRHTSRRCRNLTVIGMLDEDNRNRIRIDYWYNDNDGKRIQRTFRGERQ